MACGAPGAAPSAIRPWTKLGDELARGAPGATSGCGSTRSTPSTPTSGTRTLLDLFDGRSQLLVYHFMFGPTYEAGCPTCSSMADTFDGAGVHLRARRCRADLPSPPRRSRSSSRTGPGWGGRSSGRRRSAATSTSTSGRRTRPSRCGPGSSTTTLMIRLQAQATPLETEHQPSRCRGRCPQPAGTDAEAISTKKKAPAFSAFVQQDGVAYHTYARLRAGGGVPDRVLPNPRPVAEGTKRGRPAGVLDPPPRRVRDGGVMESALLRRLPARSRPLEIGLVVFILVLAAAAWGLDRRSHGGHGRLAREPTSVGWAGSSGSG